MTGTDVADTEDGAGADDEHQRVDGLWAGDTGRLRETSRRVLLDLVRGPYLSGQRNRALWSALLADEAAVRSRLHELFLELVVDRDHEVAFVRRVTAPEKDLPAAVRTAPLTFLDTAMLLVLRQMLLSAEADGRVIVGQEEVFEQLQVFRDVGRDLHDFGKRLNASWSKMQGSLRVIHAAGEDRVEISPVLRLLVDEQQVAAIGREYARLAGEAGAQTFAGVEGPPMQERTGQDHGEEDDLDDEETAV